MITRRDFGYDPAEPTVYLYLRRNDIRRELIADKHCGGRFVARRFYSQNDFVFHSMPERTQSDAEPRNGVHYA